MEFCGISRILRDSLYKMYEFEYFKYKFVRIKSKISELAELESANFPHRISPLIRKFFLSPLLAD